MDFSLHLPLPVVRAPTSLQASSSRSGDASSRPQCISPPTPPNPSAILSSTAMPSQSVRRPVSRALFGPVDQAELAAWRAHVEERDAKNKAAFAERWGFDVDKGAPVAKHSRFDYGQSA